MIRKEEKLGETVSQFQSNKGSAWEQQQGNHKGVWERKT